MERTPCRSKPWESSSPLLKHYPPLPQFVGSWTELPQRPAGPPDVSTRLKGCEGTLAGSDGLPEIASKDVYLRETGLRKGSDVVNATGISDRYGLAAVCHLHFRPAAGQGMQESHPVVPGRSAVQVSGLVYDGADAFQGRDLPDVLAKGKLD